MSRVRQLVFAGVFVAGLGGSLSAQDRGFVVQVLGGGYSHINNLNPAGTAHFNTGFNVGAALGYQATKYFSVHGDFTLARNKALGTMPFAGTTFNRYFYGGHVELRYPMTERFAPFIFAGGGGVTVDQREVAGPSSSVDRFTKPAAMFGVGTSIAVPNSKLSVLFEGKGLAYKWDRAGFSKNQLDLSYSLGFAYSFGW